MRTSHHSNENTFEVPQIARDGSPGDLFILKLQLDYSKSPPEGVEKTEALMFGVWGVMMNYPRMPFNRVRRRLSFIHPLIRLHLCCLIQKLSRILKAFKMPRNAQDTDKLCYIWHVVIFRRMINSCMVYNKGKAWIITLTQLTEYLSETFISLLLGELILVPYSDEASMLKNVCFNDKSFPSLPISAFHSHQPITYIL